ncbi:hypothetical protein LTR10_018943 [Elasticomyces elasticus]|uniref:FAD/NAD(P)-binding domain-containing protein n=1 Tax=Exophiala sideris TaxID=1016849 RepID=A0ABR0IYJ7_9EURO|nr:hypothetical protein LTR10_018943 [Elasticomyces elasticus]KAK5022303.1 hypothetical protein LTS07_010179 [Exophiala sideris]KAK5027115.1 hypothetical protein LTR13_009725 [Exophiala sideris]KAK5051690.1 hypothetical protein LTR69_010190 [Exophiala sideris]KAK5177655.1 hypothetical protein LTR44_009845 [Eurotiomycetes sp. CCFEE 6388]
MALIEELLVPRVAGGSDGEVPAIQKVLDHSSPTDLLRSMLHYKNAKIPAKVNGHYSSLSKNDPYYAPIGNQLAFTPRKIRVVTVGAGFSGLLMAHKFQHRFPEMDAIVDHTIFEKRAEVGGTWVANTYPGVQCDVPSHIYAFPFDPNPEWTRFYSSGAEIKQYIVRTTEKWNLDRDIHFNTKVVRSSWDEERGQWKVTVNDGGRSWDEWADVLINGQGVLEQVYPLSITYQWPDIKGLQDFKGQRVHSANWDHDYDYSNKRIAVIGNGSSGVQIVPQMAKLPGTTVTNLVRGPSWIFYRVPPSQHLGRSGKSGNNPNYTEEERKGFREEPEKMKEHRKAMIARTNKAFRMFIKDSNENKEAMKIAEQQMRERLNHEPRLCDILIPKWSLGCRRITPGEGYLEAFSLPNCDITNSGIKHIDENAIHTADGKVHEIDVLVCATGFDVSFRPSYPTVGRNGIDLREAWTQKPESYFSVGAKDMPNYFTVLGPNALAGHGSLLEGMNWNGDYFVKWIRKMAEEGIKSFVPNTAVVDQHVRYSDEIHKSLVWTSPCKSWYKQGTTDGRVAALFAGSGMLYRRIITGDLRVEDFDIEYRSANRFEFMGNGFTEFEFNPNSDLAWYIEK